MTNTPTATLSADGLYRYDLTRQWRQDTGRVVWIMLNPSTADAEIDDPTIRRCINFSTDWGFGSLTVVNRFALRATRPVHLLHHPDPVGPYNDQYVAYWITQADLIVAAWGAHKIDVGWPVQFIAQGCSTAGKGLCSLGTTKGGHPRHPLYVRGDQPLQPWPA